MVKTGVDMAVPKPLDERVAKLPEWARRHIYNQEERIRRLEKEVLKTYTIEDTNTFIDRFTLVDDTPLPPNSHVRFKYGPKAWDSIEVVASHPTGQPDVVDGIQVRTAGGRLVIQPESSNAVHVGFVSHFGR
jgi:hypothetical protein